MIFRWGDCDNRDRRAGASEDMVCLEVGFGNVSLRNSLEVAIEVA